MRTGIRAEIGEAVERGNGTEIEAQPDAMRDEMTTTGRQEGIEICLTIVEAVGEGDVVIEGIAMADSEEDQHGSERRARLLHRRKRNRHQTSQISYQFWSARDD